MSKVVFDFTGENFVVVGSEHADVDVVVPWYEPLVPYGTEECPVRQEIAYAVFPAYIVNVFQNGQFDVFDFGRGDFLHDVLFFLIGE